MRKVATNQTNEHMEISLWSPKHGHQRSLYNESRTHILLYVPMQPLTFFSPHLILHIFIWSIWSYWLRIKHCTALPTKAGHVLVLIVWCRHLPFVELIFVNCDREMAFDCVVEISQCFGRITTWLNIAAKFKNMDYQYDPLCPDTLRSPKSQNTLDLSGHLVSLAFGNDYPRQIKFTLPDTRYWFGNVIYVFEIIQTNDIIIQRSKLQAANKVRQVQAWREL